jgi:hypothetical protein
MQLVEGPFFSEEKLQNFNILVSYKPTESTFLRIFTVTSGPEYLSRLYSTVTVSILKRSG